jgi:AcrR family transcriptional regulator
VPRPPDEQRRQELLDALIDSFARDGIGGRSLRDVAEAVGTSHRMLLHHFSSRDELLLAVVQEVERRQAVTLTTLPTDPAEGLAAMWADVRRPELRPFERLFFECYARGAQGEAPFDRMHPGAIDGWLEQVARVTEGDADPAMVRFGLAVIRGLLLDLVATGDEEGVDAAMAWFLELLTRAPAVEVRGAP